MSTETSKKTGTCFVVMGFGKKTDFETGRTLDLDKSYKNMIKPAVEAAGLVCVRADEIVRSGLIDVPMYQQLLNADVVVADISTSNKNAFYELGVRHALRPYTTLVICEDGIKAFPFDVNHVTVRQYHHLGEDIGFDEVMRFRELLTKSIVEIMGKQPQDNDSPVYTFLNGLTPPAMAAVLASASAAAVAPPAAAALLAIASDSSPVAAADLNMATHSMLMQQVENAQRKSDFATAKTLLSIIRENMKAVAAKPGGEANVASAMSSDSLAPTAEIAPPPKPEDPYIIQRLALVTYKSKVPSEKEALIEARTLLTTLDPATSNDTETLGLWGAVHKRLWDLTNEKPNLDEAVRGYERGFFLRNDYYNGINLAFMLNVRAKAIGADAAEAIADFVQARRVRKEVVSICENLLANNPPPAPDASAEAKEQYLSSKYWVLATIAEAHFGLGEDASGEQRLTEAFATASADWMKDSTRQQIDKLKLLLADSPLKRIT